MPINFTQIFQDSWNFIRNQRQFTLLFMLLFTLVAIVFQFIDSAVRPEVVKEVSGQIEAMLQSMPIEMRQQFETSDPLQSPLLPLTVMTHPTMLTLSVSSQIAMSFITVCGIVYIHQLSQQQAFSLSSIFAIALRAFLGVLSINVLILLPVVYGFVLAISAQPLALVLVIAGVYLFVRLCLASFVYLLEQQKFFQALKITWMRSEKAFGTLFIFCLLNYVLLFILVRQLGILQGNILFSLLGTALSVLLYLFSIIFSYRFYTLFTKARA